MNNDLVSKIKIKAKEILDLNTRFHCYAHAIEVYENILLLTNNNESYDILSLSAAALLHDLSNSQEKEIEGVEGSKIAANLLKDVVEFPIDKIEVVERLIRSINEDRNLDEDEIVINTADEMAVFSDLGLIRSFMISGSKGLPLKEALEWQLSFIDKRFSKLKLDLAKKLVNDQYNKQKSYLLETLEIYKK